MSLDFDGVNDQVSLASQTLGTACSFLIRAYPDTQGESNAGILFRHGLRRYELRFDGGASSEKLEFESNRDGADVSGIWIMTTGMATLSEWHAFVVTYDGSSNSNDPIIYVLDSEGQRTLTVGSGLTESSTPTGSAVDETGTFVLGGDGAGGSSFEGPMGEFALWTSILTANEAAAVLNLGPHAVGGMYLYWPMDDIGSAHATDYSPNGRNGTISGAVAGVNPPCRPAGRKG